MSGRGVVTHLCSHRTRKRHRFARHRFWRHRFGWHGFGWHSAERCNGARYGGEAERPGNAVDDELAGFLESAYAASGARAEQPVIGAGGQVPEHNEVGLQLFRTRSLNAELQGTFGRLVDVDEFGRGRRRLS